MYICSIKSRNLKFQKKLFQKLFFLEAFLDIVMICPFLLCRKYFSEKSQKIVMVRNALNEISKFSIMLTTFFSDFSLFFNFGREICTFLYVFVRFLYVFQKKIPKITSYFTTLKAFITIIFFKKSFKIRTLKKFVRLLEKRSSTPPMVSKKGAVIFSYGKTSKVFCSKKGAESIFGKYFF